MISLLVSDQFQKVMHDLREILVFKGSENIKGECKIKGSFILVLNQRLNFCPIKNRKGFNKKKLFSIN